MPKLRKKINYSILIKNNNNKKNPATKNITTRSSCSSQIKPSNQKLKPRSQQHKRKKRKETETKHKHRTRSQIEIKHKRNPDHNPSQNHQQTQPPIHVHNTHMQSL